MSPSDGKDKRVSQIRDMIAELASGNLRARITPAGLNDDFDAIIQGLNMLAEEFEGTRCRQEHLETIQSSMREVLLTLDGAGNIVSTNPAAREISGFSELELQGKPIDAVFNDQGSFGALGLVEQVLENPICDMEVLLLSKNNSSVSMSLNATALVDNQGKLSGVVLVARDMGQLKRLLHAEGAAEAERMRAMEMAAARDDLQTALGELKSTQSHLVQANKLSTLGELGAGIAHELNQPLTVIHGLSGLMLDNEAELAESLRDPITTIYDEAERMRALVSNIRTFATESSDEKSVIVLGRVIQRSLALVEEQFRNEGIKIHRPKWNEELQVLGDSLVLQQVMINLLLNARDALVELPKSEAKNIYVHVFKQEGRVLLLVEDNGPGIPLALRRHIFEPFFTSKKTEEGTGLGLSIARDIVERHDGTITLVDSDKGGAAFLVNLPCRAEIPEVADWDSARQLTAEERTQDPLRILVLDDEPLVLSVVRAIVQQMGYVAEAASGGAAGWALMQSETFDVILTDFMMPDMNGEELLQAMSGADISTPVVVMTGGRTESVVDLATGAGAMECIEKPINRNKLLRIFEKIRKLKQDPET